MWHRSCCSMIEMLRYRLTCPQCGACVIASSPEEVTWELCPGCYQHVWDLLDSKMAEPVVDHPDDQRPHGALNGTLFN